MKTEVVIKNNKVIIDLPNNRIGIQEEIGQYNTEFIARWFPIDILEETLIMVKRLQSLNEN